MKLSELVHFKNQIDQYSVAAIAANTNLELDKIVHEGNGHFNNDLAVKQLQINQAFDQFSASVETLKNNIKQQIAEAERPWFRESYRLHEEEIWRHPVDQIFNLCMNNIGDSTVELIRSRLRIYADWHYAGMFIRPGQSTLFDNLLSFDPLYVVDTDYALIKPCIEQYHEQYQNRLRKCVVNDRNNEPILGAIPDGQLGFAVAYMFFNYKPFEVIRRYLTEIHTKLKPGGTFGFTFNDCDRSAAVKLVEQHFCCYTPGYLVKQMAETIGFEIVYEHNERGGPHTWLELRKPGTLTTLKGGQTLAEILPK